MNIQGKSEFKAIKSIKSSSKVNNKDNKDEASVTEKFPITNNNISLYKSSENNNQDQIMNLNKNNYENIFSQHINKPRLININDNHEVNDNHGKVSNSCLYNSDLNEEVSRKILI